MTESYEQMEARRREAYGVQHARTKKARTNVESSVPCPWCAKRNDHRKLADIGGRTPVPESELDANSDCIECEHCGNMMYVSEVSRQPIISVKQFHKIPKPEYEPLNQEEWDREQAEAERVRQVNTEIKAEAQQLAEEANNE